MHLPSSWNKSIIKIKILYLAEFYYLFKIVFIWIVEQWIFNTVFKIFSLQIFLGSGYRTAKSQVTQNIPAFNREPNPEEKDDTIMQTR